MAKQRKYVVSLGPPPGSRRFYLAGDEVSLKVQIVDDQGKLISRFTRESKFIALKSDAFNPSPIRLEMKRDENTNVRLLNKNRIEVTVTDFARTSSQGEFEYSVKWGEGFDPHASEPAKGVALKRIETPWAELTYKKPSKGKDFKLGSAIEVVINTQRPLVEKQKVTLKGPAVGTGAQTVWFPAGKSSVSARVTLANNLNIPSPTLKITEFVNHKLDDPSHKTEIIIEEYPTWKLQFDQGFGTNGIKNITQPDESAKPFRGDAVTVKVKVTEGKTAAQDLKGRIELLHGDKPKAVQHFEDFIVSAGQTEKEVSVRLSLDHRKFPSRQQREAETLTLRIVPHQDDKHLIRLADGTHVSNDRVHDILNLELRRFVLKLEKKPANQNPDRKEIFIPGDKVDFYITLPGTCTKEIKGVLEAYRPGKKPEQVFRPVEFTIPENRKADDETKVIYDLRLSPGQKPPEQDETLAVEIIRIDDENYAVIDPEQRRITNFKVSALPVVWLDPDEPVKGKQPLTDERTKKRYFRLSRGGKHTLVLHRSDALKDVLAPKVKLLGSCLSAGDIEIQFQKGKTVVEKEIQVVLAFSCYLKIQAVSECVVQEKPEAQGITVETIADHLFAGDEWLLPGGLPCAPGDQIWIRLSRDGADLSAKKKLATLKCDAFSENPGKNNAREYDVEFQDSRLSDYAGGDRGIRIDGSAGEGNHTITVTHLENERFLGDPLKIEVKKRFAFFPKINDPERMERDIVSGRKRHPVRIHLSHPARTNTAVVVTSNYAKTSYMVKFAPGQDRLTFQMDFDADPLPDDPLKIKVEPFTGNLSESVDPDKYPDLIPSIRVLFVSFDRENPIVNKTTGSVRKTGKRSLPTFSIGDKAVVRITLSGRAPDNIRVALACDAFYEPDDKKTIKRDPVPAYEVEIEKGKISAEREVEFKYRWREEYDEILLLRNYLKKEPIGGGTIRETHITNDQIQFDDSSVRTIPIRLKHIPILKFGKEGKPDGTEWIDPAGIPFIPGESGDIYISLNKEHAGNEPIEGQIKSPVLDKDYEFKIERGKAIPTDYPIRVTFKERGAIIRHNWGSHEISLDLTRKSKKLCKHYDAALQTIELYPKREIMFPFTGAISPNGPFIKGDKAEIRICLSHPSPSRGASAKLEGPFRIIGPKASQTRATVNNGRVTIPLGSDDALLEVEFNQEESIAKNNISLPAPLHCDLGEKRFLSVHLKTPLMEFDQAEWNGRKDTEKSFIAGNSVDLPFILRQDPCPENGCSAVVTCQFFQPKGGSDPEYTVVFSEDNNRYDNSGNFKGNRTSIQVPIRADFILPQNKKAQITITAQKRCRTSSSPVEIDLASPPEISFVDTNYPTIYEAGATGKDRAVFKVKPSVNPTQELRVSIESEAFGARVYMLTLPGNSTGPQEVTAVFVNGRADDEKARNNKFEVQLVPPAGWSPGNPSKVQIMVKALRQSQVTTNCRTPSGQPQPGGSQIAPPPGKNVVTPSRLDHPCNLRRLLVKISHGDNSDEEPLKRGPFEDGTFEIVRKKDYAEEKNHALVCSATKAPIIQVGGGRPQGDPEVADYRGSALWSSVTVGLDPEDKFCEKTFVVNRVPLQHPFVFVAERCITPEDFARRRQLEDLSHPRLLAPAGPHSFHFSERRTNNDLRYSWAPLYPEPDPDHNTPEEVVSFPLICAFQTEDETLVHQRPQTVPSFLVASFEDAMPVLRHIFVGRTEVTPQQYLIEAQCCGIPDVKKSYGATSNLRAIVEVFPSDEYCFYIGSQAENTVVEHLEEG